MEKHIDLMEGDTLVVRSVPRSMPPEPPEVLSTIHSVSIYASPDGTYVRSFGERKET
jgi:hypothetical protein